MDFSQTGEGNVGTNLRGFSGLCERGSKGFLWVKAVFAVKRKEINL